MWSQISGYHCAQGNKETHISNKITNVMLFGPLKSYSEVQLGHCNWRSKKVKSMTYVSLNFSALQVIKTTVSYHDKLWNTGFRSLTFALKFSKDLAWYHTWATRESSITTCITNITGLCEDSHLVFCKHVIWWCQNLKFVGVKRACETANDKANCVTPSKDDQRNSYRKEK